MRVSFSSAGHERQEALFLESVLPFLSVFPAEGQSSSVQIHSIQTRDAINNAYPTPANMHMNESCSATRPNPDHDKMLAMSHCHFVNVICHSSDSACVIHRPRRLYSPFCGVNTSNTKQMGIPVWKLHAMLACCSPLLRWKGRQVATLCRVIHDSCLCIYV